MTVGDRRLCRAGACPGSPGLGLSWRGDWCCQIAFAPGALPAKEVAFAASTRCEGERCLSSLRSLTWR